MARRKSEGRFFDSDLITFANQFTDVNEPEFDSTIWTTELVDDLAEKVEKHGLELSKVKHPFFGNDITLRRGNTSFQYTEEEMEEFKRCKKDIIYFANTYVKVMQEHGIDNITLYPYQETMLKNYQNERYNIVVGSRQIGKCFFPTTRIECPSGKIPVYKIWFKHIKGQRSITDYIKYGLYWLYDKLD